MSEPRTPAAATETVTDVDLRSGQYRTLMRLTTPNNCQTARITGLRAALDTAGHRTADDHYTVQLTAPQILAADYVLGVGALRGGDAEVEYNRFHFRYTSTASPDAVAVAGTVITRRKDDAVPEIDASWGDDAVSGDQDDELPIESIAGYLHGTAHGSHLLGADGTIASRARLGTL